MMHLTLMSPTNKQTLTITWLEVPTPRGSFVVKKGHAPLISLIEPNKEIFMGFPDGTTTLMTIAGGIVQVDREKILLLLTHE